MENLAGTPSFNTVQGSMYRTRAILVPPTPKSFDEVVFKCNLTRGGEEFVHFGDDGRKDLIVFTTKSNLNLLNNKKVYGDGTFKVVPNLWYQIYTIHAEVSGKVVPLAFSLLPSKKAETYVRMFSIMKAVLPGK